MAHIEEFFVPLPLKPPGSDRTELCVMVVDDDAADTFLIMEALRHNPRVGQIVYARDGVEALEILDKRVDAPDLAIVDLHMPRKSGFSLLVEMGCRNVDTMTLVLTSSRASSDAVRSKLRGAAQFMTKPDTLEELREMLDGAISTM
jgi:DNA-binding response OmpR family regulator